MKQPVVFPGAEGSELSGTLELPEQRPRAFALFAHCFSEQAFGETAARISRALAQKGINIQAITTSEIKVSILIDSAYTELAVRTLHSLYGLDKA